MTFIVPKKLPHTLCALDQMYSITNVLKKLVILCTTPTCVKEVSSRMN